MSQTRAPTGMTPISPGGKWLQPHGESSEHARPRILAIDDAPVNLILFEKTLAKDFIVQTAASGSIGLAMAKKSVPDLILLDVMMPDMDGFETLRKIGEEPQLQHIPVIFVTASTDFQTEVLGLESGAADYITKPINPKIVRQRIWNLLDRQRMQNELLESEKRFRTLIEWSPTAIGVHLSGTLLYANPAMLELLGAKSANELVGKSIMDRIHPDHHCLEQSRWRSSPNDSDAAPLWEEKFVKMDGSVIDVEIQGTSIDYDGQSAVRFVIRDITERRQAEESLRIAATAFDSQQGMTVTNAQGVILRVNKAFTEITGYSAEEIVGKNPRVLASGRHDSAFYSAMWASIASEGSWQGEIWNRRKNGEIFPEWLTISAVKNNAGITTHFVAAFTDISSRKTAEDQIQNLAFYDSLTGLPNRRLLLNRLEQALTGGARHHRKSALLFIDIDNFKTLNDTLGHLYGDLMLEQIAKRLSNCIRDGDTVARMGGDKFVVMLEGLSEDQLEAATRAETVGEKILYSLSRMYLLGANECYNTASIGITLFGDDPQECLDEPLKRAELAMYQAKNAGRNLVRFFDSQMQIDVRERAALEADLRDGVTKSQFILHYQAQVLGDGLITGVEALLRWQHPTKGLVSPLAFITLAESTGLIVPLGQWVLETACTQLALWAKHPELAHLSVAINVSARQIHENDFVDKVKDALAATGAKPNQLKIELTESLLVNDVDSVIAKMNLLKAMGVGFSLDDFGTGYSSLSYLKRLPLDQLKIDQSFIKNILTDSNDASIAKMVIALAKSLGLTVIAEGVETNDQRNFLADQGCLAHQGYLYSHPLALKEFEFFVTGEECAVDAFNSPPQFSRHESSQLKVYSQ